MNKIGNFFMTYFETMNVKKENISLDFRILALVSRVFQYNGGRTKPPSIGTSVRRSSGRRSGVAVRVVDCWQ